MHGRQLIAWVSTELIAGRGGGNMKARSKVRKGSRRCRKRENV